MTLLHPIRVDDREPDAAKVVSRLQSFGASAAINRLAVGDFAWGFETDEAVYGVVVERKTIGDLINSVQDDRLHHFVEDSGSGPYVLRFLLIEGDQFDPKLYAHSRWEPEQLDALLVSVQLTGVMVIRSERLSATPRRVYDLWRWTGKDDHGSLNRPALPQLGRNYLDTDRRDQVRFLMSMPVKIGETKANAILDVMPLSDAVVGFLTGDLGKFKGVKGVGKGLVDGARQFLTGAAD